MSRTATIIGSKGGKWSSISVGSPVDLRPEFKHGSFAGFDTVYYLDTSGGKRRKRGQVSSPKKAQAKGKGDTAKD